MALLDSNDLFKPVGALASLTASAAVASSPVTRWSRSGQYAPSADVVAHGVDRVQLAFAETARNWPIYGQKRVSRLAPMWRTRSFASRHSAPKPKKPRARPQQKRVRRGVNRRVPHAASAVVH